MASANANDRWSEWKPALRRADERGASALRREGRTREGGGGRTSRSRSGSCRPSCRPPSRSSPRRASRCRAGLQAVRCARSAAWAGERDHRDSRQGRTAVVAGPNDALLICGRRGEGEKVLERSERVERVDEQASRRKIMILRRARRGESVLWTTRSGEGSKGEGRGRTRRGRR